MNMLPLLPPFEEVEEVHFGKAYKLDCVMELVQAIQDRFTPKAGRERIRQAVKAHALSGSVGEAEALAAAQTWHDADFALRELMVELRQAGKPIPTALGAFYDAAMFRPITGRGERGDAYLDIFLRDMAICLLVNFVGAYWPHLKLVRSPGYTKDRPCRSSLVAEAMTRAGYKVTEGQVARIYRQRHKIVERLTTYMPPLSSN